MLDAKVDLLHNVLILHHLPNPLLRCTEDHCRYEDQILTGCIDWAPVCCSGTSGIGETRPGRAEPWCCPYWSHLNSGSPDRHAPYPAWNIQHNHQNTAQYNHAECPVRFVSMNQFIPTHWFFPVQHFKSLFAVKYIYTNNAVHYYVLLAEFRSLFIQYPDSIRNVEDKCLANSVYVHAASHHCCWTHFCVSSHERDTLFCLDSADIMNCDVKQELPGRSCDCCQCL